MTGRREGRRPNRRFSWILLLAVAACTPGERGADGELLHLKFGHVGAPGSLFAESAEEFARQVNEEMAGRVEVTVYGSSQLGGDEAMLQKLKLGTLDFSLPSTIMSSTERGRSVGTGHCPRRGSSREGKGSHDVVTQFAA